MKPMHSVRLANRVAFTLIELLVVKRREELIED